MYILYFLCIVCIHSFLTAIHSLHQVYKYYPFNPFRISGPAKIVILSYYFCTSFEVLHLCRSCTFQVSFHPPCVLCTSCVCGASCASVACVAIHRNSLQFHTVLSRNTAKGNGSCCALRCVNCCVKNSDANCKGLGRVHPIHAITQAIGGPGKQIPRQLHHFQIKKLLYSDVLSTLWLLSAVRFLDPPIQAITVRKLVLQHGR